MFERKFSPYSNVLQFTIIPGFSSRMALHLAITRLLPSKCASVCTARVSASATCSLVTVSAASLSNLAVAVHKVTRKGVKLPKLDSPSLTTPSFLAASPHASDPKWIVASDIIPWLLLKSLHLEVHSLERSWRLWANSACRSSRLWRWSRYRLWSSSISSSYITYDIYNPTNQGELVTAQPEDTKQQNKGQRRKFSGFTPPWPAPRYPRPRHHQSVSPGVDDSSELLGFCRWQFCHVMSYILTPPGGGLKWTGQTLRPLRVGHDKVVEKPFLEQGGIVAFRDALFDVAVPSILDDAMGYIMAYGMFPI